MASRVDVDGGSGLALREDRAPHHPLLELRPRRLAADLADDAGPDAGAPSPLLHLGTDLRRKVFDAPLVVGGILVLLDVVPAAHHHVHPGTLGDFAELLRSRAQAAVGQLHDRAAPRIAHRLHFLHHHFGHVEHVAWCMLELPVVDGPHVLERDGAPVAAAGLQVRGTDVAYEVLVHQGGPEGVRVDRTAHCLHLAADGVALHRRSLLSGSPEFGSHALPPERFSPSRVGNCQHHARYRSGRVHERPLVVRRGRMRKRPGRPAGAPGWRRRVHESQSAP